MFFPSVIPFLRPVDVSDVCRCFSGSLGALLGQAGSGTLGEVGPKTTIKGRSRIVEGKV